MVSDPDTVRARLLGAGALVGFRGRMTDRRFDRDGILQVQDQVLRLREFHERDGSLRVRLAWKGPTGITAVGHKSRRELEYDLTGNGPPPSELLLALGYAEVQVIDRFVEYYRLGDTDVRLEWYPRPTELFSMGVFYKTLTNPIEKENISFLVWSPNFVANVILPTTFSK